MGVNLGDGQRGLWSELGFSKLPLIVTWTRSRGKNPPLLSPITHSSVCRPEPLAPEGAMT